ncbi:MAG: amino acid adenylation domain-containing protein [Micrococcus sp.]|nr:amino acid adenylation domain-containing protein [Micrococcus sp.]
MADPVHDVDVLVDSRFDQRVRWSPGERLDHLFEQRVDELRNSGQSHRLAVDAEDGAFTYPALEERANRLARHLVRRGVRAGDRVGLLFDHALDAYTGMLATLKLNAAYVPLDPGFTVDRIAYVCRDAGVRAVLTRSFHLESLEAVAATVVVMDAEAGAIAAQPAHRLGADERGDPVDELAYVIYTSGTTGRPKGVAIEHASICNFVRVAAEVYGITGQDRIYQGMTIAFDFSVEETWVPWMAGATLVPKPAGAALVGQDLHDFLVERRITGLCCVPTLLSTLEDDLTRLRFLLVSGEACPADLITRWHRPDRRFLNAYGPPEATVTATWTTLAPDRRVTIGVPLPTYSVVILEPGSDRVVARGGVGEICIGGIALATGYLNRPDLTARAFIEDSIGLPNNPSGRIYRTGDLGRIGRDGDIEYLGRIDARVKIRGYRIELTEIESVLMRPPGIARAVAAPTRMERAARRRAGSARRLAVPSQ